MTVVAAGFAGVYVYYWARSAIESFLSIYNEMEMERIPPNAAVDDLAVHSIRGSLIHIRLAGINAEQAILGQHIQPVGIHGLGQCIPEGKTFPLNFD